MDRIVMTSETRLIGAKSAAGAGDSSLISIDISTGETAPVPSKSVYTYELAFDPLRGALYSIGVDPAGGTCLLENEGSRLEKQTQVARFDSGDFFAALALDTAAGTVYTSLGFDFVSAWNGKFLSTLPATGMIPRKLALGRGTLCALNSDSSLTIMDTAAEVKIGEIYLFPSGDWCILFPDGRFSSSDGAFGYVNVRADGLLAPDTVPYRVELPPP
jgi:hypothetical protein